MVVSSIIVNTLLSYYVYYGGMYQKAYLVQLRIREARMFRALRTFREDPTKKKHSMTSKRTTPSKIPKQRRHHKHHGCPGIQTLEQPPPPPPNATTRQPFSSFYFCCIILFRNGSTTAGCMLQNDDLYVLLCSCNTYLRTTRTPSAVLLRSLRRRRRSK